MDLYHEQGYLNCASWQVHPSNNVKHLLRSLSPSAVFVQDPRDMQAESGGCFDKWTHFHDIGELNNYHGFKVVSFKDAAVAIEYQRDFAAAVRADALATYYHEASIRRTSPWADGYKQIRHYHCVDAAYIKTLDLGVERKRGLVSGHTSTAFYPLRAAVVRNAEMLGLDVQPHPGWNNHGCRVPEYLDLLTHYKVHVATATRYGHALRKIIESVCCGCTVVTNLPWYDELPIIDDWLVRVPEEAGVKEVLDAVNKAETAWRKDIALVRAAAASEYYDFKADAARLNLAITLAMKDKHGWLES